jgi:hypothetical protein
VIGTIAWQGARRAREPEEEEAVDVDPALARRLEEELALFDG